MTVNNPEKEAAAYHSFQINQKFHYHPLPQSEIVMREEQHLRNHKTSWSKLVARKWLSLKNRHHEFESDYSLKERRKSSSDGNCYLVVPEEFSEGWPSEGPDLNLSNVEETGKAATPPSNDPLNLKMFVGTWNVGGRSPHEEDLDIRHFLKFSADPADVYVLGFQEIVPLKAGNVLGAEDSGPAAEWLSLIRQTLNAPDQSSSSPHIFKQRPSFSEGHLNTDEDDFEAVYRFKMDREDFSTTPRGGELKYEQKRSNSKYCLAASKQMVGLFLCVWVRSDLVGEVGQMRVSCVGRGIMGYLGNKGSVSISMTVYGSSFCFVCTHLAPGEKEGNEVRRNLDVLEILRKTRFGQPFRDGILDHDNVIWLGDLNYRLACDRAEMYELLQQNDWEALLQKDQLRLEQRAGRVFQGWEEGAIRFAPTYKYLPDSDQYVLQSRSSKEKPRTPAWCDRILWRGDGLKQMSYDRDETRFSDHRPVYSVFTARIDRNKHKVRPVPSTARTKPAIHKSTPMPSSMCTARIGGEEFFVITRAQSCIRAT